jgi:hypothetical protein
VTQDPDDRDLTPEEDARVRALLADLDVGLDARLPPEVAARLDDTLAGLVAEREPAAEPVAEVVPLRARWLPAAAAAAAVVVVLGGVGVATGVFRSVSGDDAASQSTSAGGSSDTSDSAGGSSAEKAPSTAATPASPPAALAAEAPTLSTARFGPQVTALLRAAARDGVPLGGDTSSQVQRRSPDCPGPAVTDGSTVRQVVLDGRAAVLVVHPARAGTSVAEAWSCDGGTRLTGARVSP